MFAVVRGVVAGQAVGVVGLDAGEVGEQRRVAGGVADRVGRVGGPGEAEVGLVELEVEQAAHERRVAVDVVGADHREDRLQRGVRADRAGEQQLVDAQIRRPVGADPPVGVRQVGGPVEDLDRVLLLDRVEQPPAAVASRRCRGRPRRPRCIRAGRGSCPTPPVDAPLVGAAADPGAARSALTLAVRRHRQQDGERSLGRLRPTPWSDRSR